MRNKKEKRRERQRDKKGKKLQENRKKKQVHAHISLQCDSCALNSVVIRKIRVRYSKVYYIPYRLNARFNMSPRQLKFRIEYSSPSLFPAISLKPRAVERIWFLQTIKYQSKWSSGSREKLFECYVKGIAAIVNCGS